MEHADEEKIAQIAQFINLNMAVNIAMKILFQLTFFHLSKLYILTLLIALHLPQHRQQTAGF